MLRKLRLLLQFWTNAKGGSILSLRCNDVIKHTMVQSNITLRWVMKSSWDLFKRHVGKTNTSFATRYATKMYVALNYLFYWHERIFSKLKHTPKMWNTKRKYSHLERMPLGHPTFIMCVAWNIFWCSRLKFCLGHIKIKSGERIQSISRRVFNESVS